MGDNSKAVSNLRDRHGRQIGHCGPSVDTTVLRFPYLTDIGHALLHRAGIPSRRQLTHRGLALLLASASGRRTRTVLRYDGVEMARFVERRDIKLNPLVKAADNVPTAIELREDAGRGKVELLLIRVQLSIYH